MKIFAAALMLVMSVACVTPDTQPVIEATLEWKKMEDEEIARHRQLLSVARFDDDPIKNVQMLAQYQAALGTHERAADQYATSIVNWAQRVGQFDPDYANKTLDQMIQIYLQIKEAHRVASENP